MNGHKMQIATFNRYSVLADDTEDWPPITAVAANPPGLLPPPAPWRAPAGSTPIGAAPPGRRRAATRKWTRFSPELGGCALHFNGCPENCCEKPVVEDDVVLQTVLDSESSTSSSPLLSLGVPPFSVPRGKKLIMRKGTIDSGAEAVVAPPLLIPGDVEPSIMSKAGREYRAANGSRIKNHGQVPAKFMSGEGHVCEMTFQVADVDRILVGVTPLTKSGNDVMLRDEDGEIIHRESGRRIHLVREGGVYVMMMYFLVDDNLPDPAPGFPRPGA